MGQENTRPRAGIVTPFAGIGKFLEGSGILVMGHSI
jgi:hypothetical protein